MRVEITILIGHTVHFIYGREESVNSINFFIDLPFKPKRRELIAIGQFIDYIHVDLPQIKKDYIHSEMAVIKVVSNGMWLIDDEGAYYSIICEVDKSYLTALERAEELEREQK